MIGRRKRRDPVTAELVEALLARDLGCVMSFLDDGHVCRDHWGERMAWNDPHGLTVEHTKDQLRLGKRGPSDLDHTVLLCAGSNIGVPSKRERGLIRDYLAARRAV